MIAQHDQLVAALAGRYEIERELGHGGMAVVYLARDVRHGRSVALKVLRGGEAPDERRQRLFEREGRALARLTHPDIARVYEAGRTDDGQPYFAMELVRGVPLGEHVRRNTPPLRARK